MNTRHVNTPQVLLFLLAFLLSMTASMAQGFIQQYPFFTWSQGGGQSLFLPTDSSYRMTALSYPDFGTDIQLLWIDADAQGNMVQEHTLNTPNSGSPYFGNDIFLLENGGYYRAYADSNQVQLKRFDDDGALLWEQAHTIPGTMYTQLINVIANTAEAVYVRYIAAGTMTERKTYILKFSPSGALLWQAAVPFEWPFVIPATLVPTADGGCMFNNYGPQAPNSFVYENIIRIGGNGNLKWFYGPENGSLYPHYAGKVFDINSADQTYLFTSINANPSTPTITRLDKLNPAGALVDSVDIGSLLGKSNLGGQLVIATADGGAVIVVSEYMPNSLTSHVAKIQPDGSLAWQQSLAFFSSDELAAFADGKEHADGSLALYAYQGLNLYLIKLSADGTISTIIPQPKPEQLRLFPNPATQRSTVQLEGLNQAGRRLVLRDHSGRIVQEWPAMNHEQEILRAGAPSGLYWLELQEQGQLIAVGKLLWID